MDSGLAAEPVIGPRFARTRWRRPEMRGREPSRHCEEQRDEAIQTFAAETNWIASLTLAMTDAGGTARE